MRSTRHMSPIIIAVLGLVSLVRADAQRIGVPIALPGTPPEASEPQAAVDATDRVYMTYGVKNAIYCTTAGARDSAYSAPVKVGESGVMSLGMRRGPRIAVTGKSVFISAVCGAEGGGRDGDLLVWRSQDEGKTWQGPSTVNDVAGAAREGLHAMAAYSDGAVTCAWLDLRSKGTKIYASTSKDGGASWSANVLVYRSPDGTVCQCCHPSLCYDVKGRLYVMWRNALGGSRDMYLSHSDDRGTTFTPAQKLGSGTWRLDACPMDGGSLSVTNGSVTTFWQRDGKMFECAPDGQEQMIGAGVQGWTAMGAQGAYLVWLERRGGRLMLQKPGELTTVLADNADDPVVAGSPNGNGPVVILWKTRQGSPSGIQGIVFLR